MNYTDLVAAKTTAGSIKNWINHDDIPATDILTEAQSLIYSRLRTREMLVLLTSTIALDATSLALPADFREPLGLWCIGTNGAGRVRFLDLKHFEDRLATDEDGELESGSITQAAVDGTNFLFNVKNDTADLRYRLWYYATPAALAAGNATNWLTIRYPHILRAATNHFGFAFRKDGGEADKWLVAAAAHIEKANVEADYPNAAVTFDMHWENR